MGFEAARKGRVVKNGGVVVQYTKESIPGDQTYSTSNPFNALPPLNNKYDDRFLSTNATLLKDILAYWDFEDVSSQTLRFDRIHKYSLERDAAASGISTTTGKFGTYGLYTSTHGSNLKLTSTQYFDSFGSGVNINTSQSITFGQEFTISIWHNPEFRSGHYANLIKKGLGAADREFSLDLNTLNTGTGNIIFKMSSGGSTFDVNLSGNVVSDSNYHFYCVRVDTAKGIVNLHIDNNEYSTSFTPSSFYRGSGQLMVASGQVLKIDGLGLWNRYLEKDEIKYIYKSRDGRDYPFDCADTIKNTYNNTLEKLATHVAPRLANQYQLGTPTVSSVLPDAYYYDLIIHSTDTIDYRLDCVSNYGIIQQKNPNSVSLAYFSSMDVPTGVDGGYSPGRRLVFNYVSGIRPEWYLTNASGERVNLYVYTTTPASGFYWAFNPSNSGAGRYFVNYIRDNISDIDSIDGVYFDWLQTKLSTTFNASSPSWRKAPVDLNQDGVAESDSNLDILWLSGYKAMLQYNLENWPVNKIHVGNAGWWTGPDYQPYVNGIFVEEFRTANNTLFTWHEQMQCYTGYQRYARTPRVSVIHTTDISESGSAFARYTFCSAMLSDGYYINTNPNSIGGYSRNRWHDEYSVNDAGTAEKSLSAKGYFGRPLGDAYNIDNPTETLYNALDTTTNAHTKKWAREYEKVLVLCNPLGVSGLFTLNRGYRKILGIYDNTFNNGANVTGSITLPPSGGCVLLKPEYFSG